MIIYIILFASLISPSYFIPSDGYSITASMEVCHSIEEVNQRITISYPEAIYSYDCETRELKELDWELFRKVKEKEEKLISIDGTTLRLEDLENVVIEVE